MLTDTGSLLSCVMREGSQSLHRICMDSADPTIGRCTSRLSIGSMQFSNDAAQTMFSVSTEQRYLEKFSNAQWNLSTKSVVIDAIWVMCLYLINCTTRRKKTKETNWYLVIQWKLTQIIHFQVVINSMAKVDNLFVKTERVHSNIF